MAHITLDRLNLHGDERAIVAEIVDADGNLIKPTTHVERVVTHIADPPGRPVVSYRVINAEAQYLYHRTLANLGAQMQYQATYNLPSAERNSIRDWLDRIADKLTEATI